MTGLGAPVVSSIQGAGEDGAEPGGVGRGVALPGTVKPREGDCAISLDPTAPGILASTALAAGERVAGRYRIEAMVGVGGMGMVYRAHDEELRIDVALKLLRPEFAQRPDAFERFRQELLLARKVSSPHVVRIHDLVSDGERRMISMDFVPGRSLEQQLDVDGPMAERDALALTRELALGLSAAHACGVIHRDLKPANVLVRDDGHALITDFGVARGLADQRMTATGMLVGTPDYVSPEQARGEDVGPRSDLYALGLILYEMLCGQRAFAGSTAAESMARRQHAAPPSVRSLRPEISPWIDRLVARLLAPQATRRFRDADAVVAAIDARHVRRQINWPSVPWALASLAILVLGAGLLRWSIADRSAMPTPAVPEALVMLPLAAEPAHSELAEAYGALIGAHLLAGDTATVDRRRTRNALRRLGYDAESAVRHTDRVLEALDANELLSGRLEVDGDRLRISLVRRGLDGETATATTDWASSESLPAALQGSLRAVDLDAGDGSWGTPVPSDLRALRAFGRGMLAPSDSESMPAFAEAVTLDPRFIAAWWQYLQVARRLLPASEVESLMATTRSVLRGVRGRDADRLRGLVALIEGDAVAAVERLQPLAAEDPHDHHTRLLYAEALGAAGRMADADVELKAMVAIDEQNAEAWLALGQNAIRAGEAQRAIDEHLARARLVFERLGQPRGEADAANALGLAYDMIGEPEQASALFTEAAERRLQLGDARGAAGSLRNLAWTHAVGGRHAEATDQLERARVLATEVDDPSMLADIASDAGLLDEEQGRWESALGHYREALAMRRAQGDAVQVAGASLNLGFALVQTGGFEDARPLFEQAESTYAAQDDRIGRVRGLHALATLDLAADRLLEAKRRIDSAMHLATETNLAEERAVLHVDLSRIARRSGDLALARRELRTAEALFEQGGDARGKAQVRLEHAQVHLDAFDPDAADAVLEVLHFAEPPSEEQRALLDVRRGEVARQRGRLDEARRLADAALVRAERSGSLPARIEARLLRARLNPEPRGIAALDADLRRYPTGEYAFERGLVDVARGTSGVAAYYAMLTGDSTARHRSREPALHDAGMAALARAGDAAGAAEARGRRDAALQLVRGGLDEVTQ
jgi:tetratricopeptide (TPR) repeat protein